MFLIGKSENHPNENLSVMEAKYSRVTGMLWRGGPGYANLRESKIK